MSIFLGKNDDDVKCDFIEFFLLWDEDKYSKKMFNTWETFRSYITCIYLYGNTLLLGMDVGNVSIKLSLNSNIIIVERMQSTYCI